MSYIEIDTDELFGDVQAVCTFDGWRSLWYDQIDHRDRVNLDREIDNHESRCEGN